MKKLVIFYALILMVLSCSGNKVPEQDFHDLSFSALAQRWDEAIPLGNGMTGALIWQRNGRLRISLDRADLWDLRPMENIGIPEWRYKWVYDQWKAGSYVQVQEKFDAPYDRQAGPTKIPAAALEFDISSFGKISGVTLDISRAVCTVKWEDGLSLDIFVEADGNLGWYMFSGTDKAKPLLVPPSYKTPDVSDPAEVITYSLDRLGYEQGKVLTTENSACFTQKCWGDLYYTVATAWQSKNKTLTGRWVISAMEESGKKSQTVTAIADITNNDYKKALKHHIAWWKDFWASSSVHLPDSLLERQWYLEQYKFGSVARADAPPVSLQAVWTADNGQLPPWKGDFHHDLNTQLSYWPAYGSNHTGLSIGFTNWLSKYRDTFAKYTMEYFETEGLNVPGVTTLTGEPMGGWIQYSFGPTVSAWLAQHFYLQWRYTSDTLFLREQAYPWLKEVARYLEQVSVKDSSGLRRLPISSSPEFFDNSRDAWFPEMTNFDLALIRWTFEKSSELAGILNIKDDSRHFGEMLNEWPRLSVDEQTGLRISPSLRYEQSHRHFSHLMAIFPLRLIDVRNSTADSLVIEKSLENLSRVGSDYWTGYSFAWLGNLYASAGNGDKAAAALRTFAECFCLPNSFHVNGDQSGTGKSKFTYRPFTLEGNFAFAAGIQEMLLQSHRGMIELFPALPSEWKDVSFENLRAEGAVLVGSEMKNGKVLMIRLKSLKGGVITIKSPFGNDTFTSNAGFTESAGGIQFITAAGDEIILSSLSGKH